MGPTLHIHLLGDFLLLSGEQPILTVNTPRLQSLLTYLVLHRDAPQSRSRLAFLLWPDSSEAQAQANLRNLVFKLLRALPDADLFVQSDGRMLKWRSDAPFTLDVADFNSALVRASEAERAADTKLLLESLQKAVDLYRGDLLPACYDEWVFAEREMLRESFARAAAKLVQLLEWRHDYSEAISYAQRLVRHDPLREATYHDLMRLHALMGDRAGALRAYHSCATVLERELGIQPNERIREDYERLLQTVQSGSSRGDSPEKARLPGSAGATSPLVGRRREWASLLEAWHAATGPARSGPRMALLMGEPGIGKTRHAEELIEWAGRQGIAVAATRCYAAEGELGFAPVVNWLRGWSLAHLDAIWRGELSRLLPELVAKEPHLATYSPLAEPWQRQRLFEAMARALLGGRSQPLLLVIDDLQWCDRDTLEFLRFLLRYDLEARLLVVGTARAEELDDEHPLSLLRRTLNRSGTLIEIELAPLDERETAELATRIAREQLDTRLTDHLFGQTEGNPLFIVEMVRSGLLPEGLQPGHERAKGAQDGEQSLLDSGAARLPATVHSVIAERLAQLSPGARNLAGLAATIGREFTFDVLVRASSEEEGELVHQLDELWQRRIVREQREHGQGTGPGAYDFTHDKLREVAYTNLSPARRRLLHYQVAKALEATHFHDLDRASAQLAFHYERAGLMDQAASYYGRAGEVARRIYSNEEAIAHFRRALELVEPSPATPAGPGPQHNKQVEAARLHESMADVLEWTGRNEQARSAYAQALAQVPANELVWRSRLQRKLGWSLRNQGFLSDALQALLMAEEALGHSPATVDFEWWQEWLQIQLDRLDVLYMEGRASEMLQLIDKTKDAVEEYATLPQRLEFHRALVEANHRLERYSVSEETMSYSRAALEAAEASGDVDLIAGMQFRVGFGLLCRRDLDQAEGMLRAALRRTEQTEQMRLQTVCLVYLSTLHRLRGQVREARQLALRSMQAAGAAQVPIYVAAAKANLAWAAWRDGDIDEARNEARAALESWRQMEVEFPFQWLAIWPLIAIEVAEGQIIEAVEIARGLLRPTQQRMPSNIEATIEITTRAWEAGDADAIVTYMRRLLEQAQAQNFL